MNKNDQNDVEETKSKVVRNRSYDSTINDRLQNISINKSKFLQSLGFRYQKFLSQKRINRIIIFFFVLVSEDVWVARNDSKKIRKYNGKIIFEAKI